LKNEDASFSEKEGIILFLSIEAKRKYQHFPGTGISTKTFAEKSVKI